MKAMSQTVAVSLYSLPVILQARGNEKEKCQPPRVPFSPLKGTWAGEGQLAWNTDRRESSHCWGALDKRPLSFKPGDGAVRGGGETGKDSKWKSTEWEWRKVLEPGFPWSCRGWEGRFAHKCGWWGRGRLSAETAVHWLGTQFGGGLPGNCRGGFWRSTPGFGLGSESSYMGVSVCSFCFTKVGLNHILLWNLLFSLNSTSWIPPGHRMYLTLFFFFFDCIIISSGL